MNKYTKLSVIIILFIALSSASIYLLNKKIDDKGERFNDEEFICEQADSYSYLSRIGTNQDLTFKKFSGTDTLYTFDTTNTLDINLSYQVSSGDFKIVLIDLEDNITLLEPGNQIIYPIAAGYRIKIVGNNAYGEIHFIINELET